MMQIRLEPAFRSLCRILGQDPAPKLEKAIGYLQSEGYEFALDGTTFAPRDVVAVQLAARRLAAGMRSENKDDGDGIDVRKHTTFAQSLRKAALKVAMQVMAGQTPSATNAALTELNNASGPEVLRLAQLVQNGSEETLSLTSGKMQRPGRQVNPYRGLRLKPFPLGKWSVSLNLLAELAPRSVLEEKLNSEAERALGHLFAERARSSPAIEV
jgi:hypothetical protein